MLDIANVPASTETQNQATETIYYHLHLAEEIKFDQPDAKDRQAAVQQFQHHLEQIGMHASHCLSDQADRLERLHRRLETDSTLTIDYHLYLAAELNLRQATAEAREQAFQALDTHLETILDTQTTLLEDQRIRLHELLAQRKAVKLIDEELWLAEEAFEEKNYRKMLGHAQNISKYEQELLPDQKKRYSQLQKSYASITSPRYGVEQ